MCWFTGLSSCIVVLSHVVFFFFFNDTATTEIYTLSLHDALPISAPLRPPQPPGGEPARRRGHGRLRRAAAGRRLRRRGLRRDRKSTRLNSSHSQISYAVFCLKKKKKRKNLSSQPPPHTRPSPDSA